jgi:hypothetical protein
MKGFYLNIAQNLDLQLEKLLPHGAEARFRGLGGTDLEKTARNICREGGARSSRPDDRKSEDSKRSGEGSV